MGAMWSPVVGMSIEIYLLLVDFLGISKFCIESVLDLNMFLWNWAHLDPLYEPWVLVPLLTWDMVFVAWYNETDCGGIFELLSCVCVYLLSWLCFWFLMLYWFILSYMVDFEYRQFSLLWNACWPSSLAMDGGNCDISCNDLLDIDGASWVWSANYK